MKEVKLSDLLKAAGHDPNNPDLRVVIDYVAHLSFPNRADEDYPGFGISFPGYGEMTTDDEVSEPVWIEYPNANGDHSPNVCIWPDINSEDATVVDLDLARNSLRKA